MYQSIKRLVTSFPLANSLFSGTLEQGEIRELMASLGKKLDRMQLTEVMKQLDLSGDGHVDFDEFKTWWYKTDYGSEDYEWERDRYFA
eukprot:SAG31_NODE_741_length_12429_cov_13.571127_12_plen_88_part_00